MRKKVESDSKVGNECGRSGFSDLPGRCSLMTSIAPSEGSTLVYKEHIMAMTSMSQLEGLAGYTPVRTPFCGEAARRHLNTSPFDSCWCGGEIADQPGSSTVTLIQDICFELLHLELNDSLPPCRPSRQVDILEDLLTQVQAFWPHGELVAHRLMRFCHLRVLQYCGNEVYFDVKRRRL